MEVRNLVLLSGPAQETQDQRLLSLAAWMGVSTKAVAIRDGGVSKERLLNELEPSPCCVAMSSATLTLLNKGLTSGTELRHFINKFCAELLVFGCGGFTEQNSALSWLTAGVVCGISQVDGPDTVFTFPPEAIAFSRQLAGLSFSRQNREPVAAFELRDTPVSKVILAANDRPMFVRIDSGPCQLFLLAGPPLPDLDEPLSRGYELQGHYDRLIPVLIFLRHSFRESCWQGPEPTARLIIDDPLLTERYGFLDYSVLLKSMHRSNYGTSIAFIPWNYWRTSTRASALLLSEGSNLSICIHGCDHTNKEFEAQAPALLDRRAGLAMQRMESQRNRIGAGFERVMVFPQGRFSTAAMPALRANNYLAVVNTTCFPTNSGPDDLKLGEFLRPAVTRFNGFPIFQRRYPRRLFDFAFDIFFGRPALLVEHHEYFRNGYGILEDFVAELQKLEPALSWPTLDAQLARSCLTRKLSNGVVEVQFFTRRFQLANREGGSDRFLLTKHEPDAAVIQSVLVDGTSMPFFFDKSFLKLEIQVDDPGRVLNIEIMDRQQPRKQASGFGIIHNTGVLLRRGLSEFRDNTLARHGGLLKTAKRVARVLRVTGDS